MAYENRPLVVLESIFVSLDDTNRTFFPPFVPAEPWRMEMSAAGDRGLRHLLGRLVDVAAVRSFSDL